MLTMCLTTLAAVDPLEHVLDKPILTAHGVWLISNNLLGLFISAGLMLLIFPYITRAYRRGEHVPTGTRNFFEAMLVYVREEIARPVLGEYTDQYLPFLWTLFFFILFNNLLGLLPLDVLTGWFLEPLGFHPYGGTATANIYVTAALAIIAFVYWQVNGIRANGLGPYLKHFLAGAPLYLAPLMIPLEIVGSIIKPFALAIRLFANMFAGHMVLAVLLSFTAMAFAAGAVLGWSISIVVVIGSVLMMFLELFVAFLQTYIFVFLTAMFIGQLVVHEHHHKEGEGGRHDESHDLVGGGDLTDLAEIPDAPRQAGTHMAG
ncbi:MAG TPA: F0F1 ATP synthase subunit A [Tepidisphaeraceae bacterium]|nr:F0F1 ATP synthase subunit A [Tepidisphaeraceae bacterium]